MYRKIKELSLFFIFFNLLFFQSIAQVVNIPLGTSFGDKIEKSILSLEGNIHTAIKPYNHFEVGTVVDSVQKSLIFEKEIDKKFTRWLFNAAFNDHFLQVKDKNNKYSLILNPLMDIRAGTTSDSDLLPFVNTRGIQLMGHIGKNLTFYSDLYENQARFPQYVNDWIEEYGVVPGQGAPKVFNSITSENTAYDFANVSGNITYQPNEFFNFQFGHGKNFIGEGYRSLLLSDNAFNYPFFKIRTSFWKLNYVNLFTQMRNIDRRNPLETTSKYVSSHYLSINVTKNFNIGLFESVVYQDSVERFNIDYLNPIILYRPIEFAAGSARGNALIGLTLSYKIKKKMMLYSQFMMDEFKFEHILKADGWYANKFAFQLGFKSFDTFVEGLKFLTEFNFARPYIYTHLGDGRSYSHYRQSLTHPLGANFVESMTKVHYQKDRWFGELELMYAIQGRDTLNSNWGSDIFQSYNDFEQELDNTTTQGVRSTTLYVDMKIGYIVNPKTNLRIETGITLRNFLPEVETIDLKPLKTTYFYFGITTALTNKYYDF